MNVGELFVQLGIKGSEKTLGALGGVTKGLGEAKSMSIEAKAAILGAVYAFERLMKNSSQAGTNLTNFSVLTGLSAKQLQQWQWAAMQAGDTTEDFTSSVKGVQQAVNNMLLNKSAPEYIGMITRHVKEFDPSRLRDTFYLMGKLQEAAQNMPADLGLTMLRSFGLGDATVAAMRRNAFTPDMLNKAPLYSEQQVSQLDRANIAWANLGNRIEMAFGRFNAAHGVSMVNDIAKITDSVIRLTEALIHLMEVLKVPAALSKLFGGAANIITDIGERVEGKRDFFGDSKGKSKINETTGTKIFDFLASGGLWGTFLKHGLTSNGEYGGAMSLAKMGTEAPLPRVSTPSASAAPNKVDIKQTVIFQGHHDAPKRTTDALKKQVGDYVKQSAVKVQGS